MFKNKNLLTLRTANQVLVLIIIVCNLYVLSAPLIPRAQFQYKKAFHPIKINTSSSAEVAKIDRSKNHLIIPSAQLDNPIYDGKAANTINKGIWRIPTSSTPEAGSNTVMAGHRFSYKNPAVFYNLDRVKQGDDILAVYEGKIYHYKVQKVYVVDPNNKDVETSTDKSQLTLYTCTPLWTSKQRLVINSELVNTL